MPIPSNAPRTIDRPSAIYVDVRLDPFYQTFLRHFFNSHELVFSFPKQNKYRWSQLLHMLVVRVPPNYRYCDYGEDHFRIELPQSHRIWVGTHCYLTPYAQSFLANRIRGFYLLCLYTFYEEAVIKCGAVKLEAAEMFQLKYGLQLFDLDRIIKDLTRYKQKIKADIGVIHPAPWPVK
jgi:hypothetical protein